MRIKEADLFNINFYKKEMFHGSCGSMRYRIAAQNTDDGRRLRVTVWPGPYNYASTPDQEKRSEDFPFSREGLSAAAARLNEIWEQEFDG